MAVQIGIVSGKGGTGKTTLTASFAAAADDVVLVDCDVDAPDLHILLHPVVKSESEFSGSKVASIDVDKCTRCGLCETHCRFGAVDVPEIDALSCEGCGVCAHVCPVDAIDLSPRLSGYIFESATRYGPMAHARLLPGEGNSGRLVTEVRKLGERIANATGSDTILIDGSPGIGCPVIATVTGLQLAVVVTEPTMSGLHDLDRILSLLERFRVPATVVINKYDLNVDNTRKIEDMCQGRSVEVLGRLPFDTVTTDSMVAALPLPEYAPSHSMTERIVEMWDRVIGMAH